MQIQGFTITIYNGNHNFCMVLREMITYECMIRAIHVSLLGFSSSRNLGLMKVKAGREFTSLTATYLILNIKQNWK